MGFLGIIKYYAPAHFSERSQPMKIRPIDYLHREFVYMEQRGLHRVMMCAKGGEGLTLTYRTVCIRKGVGKLHI